MKINQGKRLGKLALHLAADGTVSIVRRAIGVANTIRGAVARKPPTEVSTKTIGKSTVPKTAGRKTPAAIRPKEANKASKPDKPLEAYREQFGLELGSVYFMDGVTWEHALLQECSRQQSELVELKAKRDELLRMKNMLQAEQIRND